MKKTIYFLCITILLMSCEAELNDRKNSESKNNPVQSTLNLLKRKTWVLVSEKDPIMGLNYLSDSHYASRNFKENGKGIETTSINTNENVPKPSDFKYTLSGNKLTITLQDGYVVNEELRDVTNEKLVLYIPKYSNERTYKASNSKNPSPQERIETVIKAYFDATNKRNPKAIADLIYPGVYRSLERLEVEKFYYEQFNNMKTFKLESVTFEESCILIDESKNHKVFLQKYKMKTTIGLDSASAVSGFQVIQNIALKSDAQAVINEVLHEVSYHDKKQIMIIKDENNHYFILPETFLTKESAAEFDFENVKKELILN